MTWTVAFHPAFAVESRTFSDGVRRELFSSARLLEAVGPQLGRPTVDTLRGSRERNL
jgi:hypothetical protein